MKRRFYASLTNPVDFIFTPLMTLFYVQLCYYSSLSLLRCPIIRNAAYYDTRSVSHYKSLEIYTRCFDSLDITYDYFFSSQQYDNNKRLLYAKNCCNFPEKHPGSVSVVGHKNHTLDALHELHEWILRELSN